MTSPRWKELTRHSACDLADALLKLNVPGAGFLADIKPIPQTTRQTQVAASKAVAPASTFLMVSKATGSFPNPPEIPSETPGSNLKDATPYSDLTLRDTIVLISQPAGQACAVVGGIMGARMKHLGAQGIVVDGRVRDLGTLGGLGLPVWSHGTSIIGAGAESKFHAKEVPLKIGNVIVEPGDIIMVDSEENGVVAVPKAKLDEVLALLPKLVEADEKVIKDVENGVSVSEAFKRHRG